MKKGHFQHKKRTGQIKTLDKEHTREGREDGKTSDHKSNLSSNYLSVIIFIARVTERENMANEIVMKIILAIVGFITTGLMGYLVAKVKEYKSKENNQEKALKCLLRSAITSKYYVYTELKAIPMYEKENIIYMYEQYKAMGGNSYIDKIIEELSKLPIKK